MPVKRFRRYNSISSAFRSANLRGQLASVKRLLQMLTGLQVSVVSLGGAHGKFGIILRVEVHPFFKLQVMMIFFGCYCLLIGYVILRSLFLPRIIDSFSWSPS